jgi:hypothetical protein
LVGSFGKVNEYRSRPPRVGDTRTQELSEGAGWLEEGPEVVMNPNPYCEPEELAVAIIDTLHIRAADEVPDYPILLMRD